ncbi:double-strand break repair helicase AddA [Novosphingobium sp.]|uniref:double-strand break repair helicase AddA n=1 Tax=Novosphingobium sp. TaxID=1874826 RepID=UPI0025D67731|nr:double-strand break repair helicase AddA [Novosphingobium sp.]MCC6924375.1 double-strand break repair helicase AddA [Novosphingobium sp.]
MSGGDKLFPLTPEQRPAVDPGEVVWLSASAGTGKTQVLSARVLRLLLQSDVSPSEILCLTFTKAGAAEMAARINRVLARWVRLEATALATELKYIGADFGPETQARARTLFAQVLDCPGGGLRIDTIHAFAQWLLAAFPHEAGLVPGVKAMEDRDRALLLREVLAAMLVEAEAHNDAATLGALEALSVRLGPDAVETWLLRCAGALEAFTGPGGWQAPMHTNVLRLLGLPSDASEADLAALCGDDAFDVDGLRCLQSAYNRWSAASAEGPRQAIGEWLSSTLERRAANLDQLWDALFTQKGELRNRTNKNLLSFEEFFVEAGEGVRQSLLRVRERRSLLELARWLTPALELGRKFALAWDDAKQRAGLIDFDDQIRVAARLLKTEALADWIRYKLDRRFDHVLVDEAQDTNEAQWRIIEALTGEFFAGEGAAGDKLRTLFVVGDYKQAIFRFQGTSPENFEAAKRRVRDEMAGLAGNVQALRGSGRSRELQERGLGTSFRTARPVLEFVDMAIARIGAESFGLSGEVVTHEGEERPGQVVLWQVVSTRDSDEDDSAANDNAPVGDDEGAETWLDRADRQLADRIARQVRDWMEHGFPLVKGQPAGQARRATPGDVMVLVRKRKELAGLIVARLYAAGVPVAGVDRLRLAAPLAVRDLMAALRFAAQPLDDLNLACLLVSPLIGWSQEQLLEYGHRPEGQRLWDHLRRQRGGVVDAATGQLRDLLGRADFEPPQALLHWLLTGPWQARQRLVARLGGEANDPIDELLNAASAFAASEVAALHTFIRWFDAGEGELKREAGKAGNEVRVMTVHGSKGLQAPIVVLADAADNPDSSRGSPLKLIDPASDPASPRLIPLPPLRKDEKAGPILEVENRAAIEERQEHWRLLYVAMTRAEEALFVAGSLGPREKAPAEDSWYARLQGLFLDEEWLPDPIWGRRLEHGAGPDLAAPPAEARGGQLALLPPWLERPVASEPRPPRPLAPSALGEDRAVDPPYPPGSGGAAARRGVLLHRLLERLPDVPVADRKAAAQGWLAKSAADLAAPARAELAEAAIRVLEHKHWAELFAPGALAEVPIAATVGGQVVAGTIDRLLVQPERIRLVDFKTARRPPASLDEVPVAILRQMAAYAAALEATYPGRPVEAALLYTEVPMLLEIPPALLLAHKQALALAQ